VHEFRYWAEYKSGNAAPGGVKMRLYSKLYLYRYRVLQETKRGPAFRRFTSNGEGANTAEYRRTDTYRHDIASLRRLYIVVSLGAGLGSG
jgi:hypothetical protein